MKKIFYLLAFLLLLTNMVRGQEYIEHPFYLSIYSGLDYNQNAYKMDQDQYGFNYKAVQPHYNIGASFSILALKRFRPRIELKYVKMSYKIDWSNTSVSQDSAAVNDFTGAESDCKLDYINLNVFGDYKLIDTKLFEMYLSAGIKTEYNMDYDYYTYDKDGHLTSESFYGGPLFSNYFPRTSAGCAFGTTLKFNLNQHIGLILTPEYTYFFRNFVRGNDKSYTRFSVDFGFEFHL
jgi:hypothetical protein